MAQSQPVRSMRLHSPGYAWTWRLPMIVWQGLFFVGPLAFMVAMSFFVVKNYRMQPAFVLDNWLNMLGKPFFWSAYWLTLELAVLSTIAASLIAFPASYFLGIKTSEGFRRWAIFLLVVPFFTSYLVRTYSWQVILAENGIVNGLFRMAGLGTVTMLNTKFASLVGYLTLCLPLVVILQTIALANVDKRLIEAAYNLGCGKLNTVFQVIIPAAKTGPSRCSAGLCKTSTFWSAMKKTCKKVSASKAPMSKQASPNSIPIPSFSSSIWSSSSSPISNSSARHSATCIRPIAINGPLSSGLTANAMSARRANSMSTIALAAATASLPASPTACSPDVLPKNRSAWAGLMARY